MYVGNGTRLRHNYAGSTHDRVSVTICLLNVPVIYRL
jgi:hypothetical protein